MTVRIEFLVYRFFHIGLSILIAALFLSLALLTVHSAPEIEPPAQAAADSPVISYLQSIACTQTVAGQHNREPNSDPALWTRWIYSVTKRCPKLWGGDFLYLPDDVNNRSTMIAEAKRQWNRGALVTLMWHVCPPTIAQTYCDWTDITGDLTDDQWNELVTPSSITTTLYHKWRERLNEIVPHLKDLEANGVEVLWRPLHEMNDDWCWWCGRPGENGSRKLYQITYDYLVNTKGLTNLTWVWNVKDVPSVTTILSATEIYLSYDPGDEYVDVVSMNPWNHGFTQENYSATLIIARGKPIAIGETGKLPPPPVLTAQPCWVWVLGWAELVSASNTITEIRAFYNDPRVVKLCPPTSLPLIVSNTSPSISTCPLRLTRTAR